jgi:RNA recognition motif-containing protein
MPPQRSSGVGGGGGVAEPPAAVSCAYKNFSGRCMTRSNYSMSGWGAQKESSGWKTSSNEAAGAARSRSRSPPRRERSPSPRGGAGASSSGGGAVKLYVGNLSFNTNKDSLFDLFGKYGTVVDAFVAMDRDAGRSKGFGFVTFEDPQSASSAKDAANGQEVDGRTIRVDFAGEKPAGGDRTCCSSPIDFL